MLNQLKDWVMELKYGFKQLYWTLTLTKTLHKSFGLDRMTWVIVNAINVSNEAKKS